MALDKKVFTTRAKTALIYVAVMLTGLLWNEWSFFILFSFVHFGCWYEYQKLSVLIDPSFNNQTMAQQFYFPIYGWGWMLMAVSDQLVIGGLNISNAGEWIVSKGSFVLLLLFIFDKNQILRFHGGIDDSPKDELLVKERYAEDAIKAILTGSKVIKAEVPFIGCSIKWAIS